MYNDARGAVHECTSGQRGRPAGPHWFIYVRGIVVWQSKSRTCHMPMLAGWTRISPQIGVRGDDCQLVVCGGDIGTLATLCRISTNTACTAVTAAAAAIYIHVLSTTLSVSQTVRPDCRYLDHVPRRQLD